MNKSKLTYKECLLAQYKFDDENYIGKDSSGQGNDAKALGTNPPVISTVGGKKAAVLSGGINGTSYFKLPEDLLKEVSDNTGLTVLAWINLSKGSNVWERVYDFGKGTEGPYVFLTRNFRGVCFCGGDLAADPGKTYPTGEWLHVAMTMIGTKGGTLSSAGPVIYVNGEVVGDGLISQTSSGTYAKLREWFATFEEVSNYANNCIGKSQYDVDLDFAGSFADFRVYKAGLTEDEVIEVMCESLTDEDITKLARDKYLSFNNKIITENIEFPTTLMGGKVNVSWSTSDTRVLSNDGKIQDIKEAKGVTITALLSRGTATAEREFKVSVLPKDLPPYTLTIDNNEVVDISETLFGLFYEDINNAADGGIYAELIQNRSFEAFTFENYNVTSGENGKTSGRKRNPLFAWFGDLDKVEAKNEGGLNEFFHLADKDINNYYISVKDGATIYNRGFCDSNNFCSMAVKEKAAFDFTVWAKADKEATITLELQDADGNAISDKVTVAVEGNGTWEKYGVDEAIVLTANKTAKGQLALSFAGDVAIDMVSFVPQDVWGAKEEAVSRTAHANYKGNKNYRLRRDLVESLVELYPTFLRFPGGCISEGSYIWDNVYDWKDSVDDIEVRKENFNVWGYMMSMGLGYMEYFQLAEDLNATPLPVMACGVLCQARSDYANPAGGTLRDKYIKNFTDLIDFAISTDFEGNEWAAMRKKMGHVAPFDLHYLGVGNENWGTEFFASFEAFYIAIREYMDQTYPGYELYVISTVGAQADDDAYQDGWKFLSGNMTGGATVAFTDGETSTEEGVTWYEKQPHYMETIADEHYYRSNEYLLNNVDRYNYYYRACDTNGKLIEGETSKVFVGEYASSDKNTLAGAVAEAAVMTGFENNSDVVRLAATAPLFNKVLTDSLYRWTPDCIWFDDETVWRTPNYYVQQLFAKYIGKKVLSTSFETYVDGKQTKLIPSGGIEVATANADIIVKSVKVTSNGNGTVLFEQDFTEELKAEWQVIPGAKGYEVTKDGLLLKAQETGLNGLYILNDAWTNYTVTVVATKRSGIDAFYVGAGLTEIAADKKNVIEYAIAYGNDATGVKVYKEGIEGYRLGDYSSSTAAGNLRRAAYEAVALNTPYTITVNYGGETGKNLICSYTDGTTVSKVLDYKLEAYNKDVFNSVTRDGDNLYIKLVNADNYSKKLQINLNELRAKTEGKLITLSGDNSLVHVPNVNKKEGELVVPMECEITVVDGKTTVDLPANSLVVIVL